MGLVRADLVVVAGEEVDTTLELVEGGELVALGEPLLERPVVALDLALGLGMVGLACLKPTPSAARSISRAPSAPR
jgi:hypothetical protein